MLAPRGEAPREEREWQRLDGGRLLVDPSYLEAAGKLGWDRAAGVCDPQGGEEVRSTPGRRTSCSRLGGQVFFRKVHHQGWGKVGWRDRFRLLCGPLQSPARTEFLWNRHLDRLGVGVTRPVLLAEMGGPREPSALVSLGVEDADSLHRAGPERGRPALETAARMTATLHRHGLVHRDLYLDHFLLGRDGQLRLADLQRVIKPWIRFGRWRVKDLAAVYHSRPDWVGRTLCLRFFLVYCRQLGLTHRRGLLDLVRRKSARIAGHQPRWG